VASSGASAPEADPDAPGAEVDPTGADSGNRTTVAVLPTLIRSWFRDRPWAQVLILFVASRVLDALILTRVQRFQADSSMTDHQPSGYFGFVSLWDGEWYRRIAEGGYPDTIPRDELGTVHQNQWAFYPLFPFLSRIVMSLFGVGWPMAASTVAVICAAAAVVLMRSLLEPLVGRGPALWTVALFLAFPSAPVLQLAYSESLAVLLLVGALWALQREKYALLSAVVLLSGLSRPIAVPLAVVIGVHLMRRMWWHYRGRATPAREDREPGPSGARPLTLRAFAGLLLATAMAGVAAVAWPMIAWMGTGERNAYLETMGAWRVQSYRTALYPWWARSQYHLGEWVGPLVLVVVLGLLLWWVTGPRARIIAGDLRVWVLSYVGYLLLVLDPHTSLARYLLLLFPLGALLVTASDSKAYRRILVIAFLAGQVLWVAWLWRFSPPSDWPP
jgi:hypothetical protein